MKTKIDFTGWTWGNEIDQIANSLCSAGAQVMFEEIERDWNEGCCLNFYPDLTATMVFLGHELERRFCLSKALKEHVELIVLPTSRQPWDDEIEEVRLFARNLRKLSEEIEEAAEKVASNGTLGPYSEEARLRRFSHPKDA